MVYNSILGFAFSRGMGNSILYAGFTGDYMLMLLITENYAAVPAIAGVLCIAKQAMHTFFPG